MTKSRKATCAIVLVGSFGFGVAQAEVEYEVRVGAAHTDNVGRTDVGELDETIGLVGIDIDASHNSRRVTSSLVGDIEYRHYADDTFDDESVGTVNASVDFSMIEDTLSWVIDERFGKLQTDPFRSDGPQNRENINSFSTGPNVKMNLGQRTEIELRGRYSDNRFEESDLVNNNVLNGSLSISRALSPNRGISLLLSSDRVEFDDSSFNSNFDRQSAMVRFASRISRGTVQLGVGVNELHDRGDVTDGTLVNVEITRELTPRSELRLTYDQRFSDAADMFRATAQPGRDFANVNRINSIGDPFETRRGGIDYSISNNGNRFYVSASRAEDRYERLTVLDRDLTNFAVGISRQFAGNWTASLRGSLTRSEFVEVEREDDDRHLTLGINRRLTQRVSLDLSASRIVRDSDVALASYEENYAALTLRYSN